MIGIKSQVTLQDIAERVGVSRATVSLALRASPAISDVTRERVKIEARRLGYRPNPLISTLMSYQRMGKPMEEASVSLAMIFDFARQETWHRYLSPNLIQGVADRAERYGFHLEQFWMKDLGMTQQRLSQVLYNRGIPGFIVAPLRDPDGELQMDWDAFSAVAVGYSLARPEIHRVTSERHQSLLLALRRLKSAGYCRIGLAIHTNEDSRVHHRWIAAFLREQEQMNPSCRIPVFLASPDQWEEFNFARWFEAHHPEVVLATTTDPLEWLQALGFRIPYEVGFVHLWNPNACGRLSGVYHNDYAIGEAAVDTLVAMIHRNERGLPATRQTLVLSTTWCEGSTILSKRNPGAPSRLQLRNEPLQVADY